MTVGKMLLENMEKYHPKMVLLTTKKNYNVQKNLLNVSALKQPE